MASPRSVAFILQLLIVLTISASFICKYARMIIKEEEPGGDRFGSLLAFSFLPPDFPFKTDPACLPQHGEPRSIINVGASITGFRPITRLTIAIIALIGLLYFILELTYLSFLMVAVDAVVTSASTGLFMYKYGDIVFGETATTCAGPAALRSVETIFVLANFIVLSIAVCYLKALYKCVIVVEKKSRRVRFIAGSPSVLTKMQRLLGNTKRSSGMDGTSLPCSGSRRNTEISMSSSSRRSRRSSRSDPMAASTRSSTLSQTQRIA